MKYTIAGAGIAGLAFAYEAAKRGHQVEVLERAPFHGGLCRSFEKNDCILDIGVHLFHGRDPKVLELAREVVDSEKWVKVKRNGKLYVQGRHITWPLKMSSVFQMPLTLTTGILWDQLFGKAASAKSGRSDESAGNYESEILSIYGKNLYEKFFRPLTEKFFKIDTKDIHSDWAFSSIRSATKIEDRNFKDNYKYLIEDTSEDSKKSFNIFRFAATNLANSFKEEEFYYFTEGYGTLADGYVEKIRNLGGKVLLNSNIEGIEIQDGAVSGVRVGGALMPTDNLVWTGDLSALCKILQINPPGVMRLHSKFVYVFLRRCSKKHQVCYYADMNVGFVRGTILSNHYQGIVRNPDVQAVVCLEYTSTQPYPEREPEIAGQEHADILRDLASVDLIRSHDDVLDTYALTVPNTYPIFTTDYRMEMERVKKELAQVANLRLFGRQGAFTYENADVLIKEANEHPAFDNR